MILNEQELSVSAMTMLKKPESIQVTDIIGETLLHTMDNKVSGGIYGAEHSWIKAIPVRL